MHYFKIERARERGTEKQPNATKVKNVASTAARNPQTRDPSGVSGASQSPPRAVPPGKAARVRNGRGLGHVRVAMAAQGLPPSLGMQCTEAKGESVVKPTLQRSVSSHTIGTRATQGLTPSLASNRAASWPQLTQFNFQRTAHEGGWLIGPLFHFQPSSNSGQNF